jgi:hypothetical protein
MCNSFKASFAWAIGLCLTLGACSDSNNDRDGDKSAAEAATAILCAVDGSPLDSSRLFLQQLTATSVIVKWRGEGVGDGLTGSLTHPGWPPNLVAGAGSQEIAAIIPQLRIVAHPPPRVLTRSWSVDFSSSCAVRDH